MLFLAKFKVKLILAGIIISLLFGIWWAWNDMQATIQRQAGVIVAQDVKIKGKEKIILQQKSDIKKQRIITNKLNNKFNVSRTKVEQLEGKFDKLGNSSKITRDLGKLAIAKPRLIQRVINNGSKESLRCIEIISGAELTADEMAATRKSQINDACYEIANPSYLPH